MTNPNALVAVNIWARIIGSGLLVSGIGWGLTHPISQIRQAGGTCQETPTPATLILDAEPENAARCIAQPPAARTAWVY